MTWEELLEQFDVGGPKEVALLTVAVSLELRTVRQVVSQAV